MACFHGPLLHVSNQSPEASEILLDLGPSRLRRTAEDSQSVEAMLAKQVASFLDEVGGTSFSSEYFLSAQTGFEKALIFLIRR
jgi:hypothetical protein